MHICIGRLHKRRAYFDIHIYIYINTHLYLFMYMYMQMYTCMSIYVHIRIHIHICKHKHTHIHTNKIYIFISIYIYIQIYTYIYMYTGRLWQRNNSLLILRHVLQHWQQHPAEPLHRSAARKFLYTTKQLCPLRSPSRIIPEDLARY